MDTYMCIHYTRMYIQLYRHMKKPLKQVHFNLSSVELLTAMETTVRRVDNCGALDRGAKFTVPSSLFSGVSGKGKAHRPQQG